MLLQLNAQVSRLARENDTLKAQVDHPVKELIDEEITELFRADDSYGYASRLAISIWEKHYKESSPHWKPLDTLMGVLTQIDNMTAGLLKNKAQEK